MEWLPSSPCLVRAPPARTSFRGPMAASGSPSGTATGSARISTGRGAGVDHSSSSIPGPEQRADGHHHGRRARMFFTELRQQPDRPYFHRRCHRVRDRHRSRGAAYAASRFLPANGLLYFTLPGTNEIGRLGTGGGARLGSPPFPARTPARSTSPAITSPARAQASGSPNAEATRSAASTSPARSRMSSPSCLATPQGIASALPGPERALWSSRCRPRTRSGSITTAGVRQSFLAARSAGPGRVRPRGNGRDGRRRVRPDPRGRPVSSASSPSR